jgi:hypothetical protein
MLKICASSWSLAKVKALFIFFSPVPSLRTSRQEIHDFPTLILPGDLQKLKIVRYLHNSKRRNKELIKARRETHESTQLAEHERKK